MEGCVLAGFIYGHRKKRVTETGQRDCPHTLPKKKKKKKKLLWACIQCGKVLKTSLNRLFQEVVGDGEGWYKEKTVTP